MRRIRLFPDYDSRWCLWEDAADDYNVTASSLGASRLTEEKISRWFDDWERHVTPEKDWESAALRNAWINDGIQLVRELNAELNANGIVVEAGFL
ncbi:hypothetical protein [Rathayibacter sp. AY2B3]|uniref:hypothetical protein n=1 Tax=Rathayibacter sp. AY2B3 TaxID=2080569 RepID=UPI0011B01CB5|nr:hypothetical protein [Rathayibacter sp. AY2B3]